ncbi:TPR domain protein, putative component of TonB system [Anaerovibrio sp. JC8]|uniref:O-linked N-acetylglucosamine transferase, SPINDLY family protein n=1 Tax=Anaerovibrio sp. JC8 TaxID=1240085 RepID=UPI000A0E8EFD|nr:hypothetical protein [Anaerovibrio sp. JC8]ORU00509.1 TPR domain protein, putative component of TonB system [Anaerovibrio sp. JC8]
MANMTKECWKLYIKIHDLWKMGLFHRADDAMGALLEAGGDQVSKAQLLGAYIKRSLEDVLGELAILESLEKSGCTDEPELKGTVYSMLGQAYNTIGRADKAVESFLQSVEHEEEWQQKLVEYSNAVFAAASLPDTDKEFWQTLYEGYDALLSEGNVEPYTPKPRSHHRIRIGYLSSDFRQHPVSSLLWPLLDKANNKEFQIFCYAGNKDEDAVTKSFREKADVYRQVCGWTHDKIARQIHIDEIDILVDLGGHTSNNMLPVLAYRPARIQLSAIGWVGSTGMQAVDYVLGDEYCSGSEQQDAYVEKLLPVKNSHFCFHIFKKMPAVAEAPWQRNGYITYGCFNNFAKVTDDMLKLWGQILSKVPQSRLLLKHKLFDHETGREYTLKRLGKCGIPADRVELRGFSEDYLQQYGDMDIALDTFPYTGGMTTFEAMYMGVPVVSLYGDSRGQRFGYSMLMNMGLEDMTTSEPAEYVEIAAALGNNPDVVADLRLQLRDMVKASPLMDEAGYAAQVEQLYHQLMDGKR